MLEPGLGGLGNGTKRIRIMHSDICQHFTVNGNICKIQTVDQTAVGQTVQPCGRVDASDPQCAKLALALPTIAIGVLAGLDDSLFGSLE